MPYGNYWNPNYFQGGGSAGGGYSANPVTSLPGSAAPYGAGPGGASAFDVAKSRMGGPDMRGAMTEPARYDQEGGGGMGAAGWMALFQGIGDKLEGRRQAQVNEAAARNAIPADPSYLLPYLREMEAEGKQLASSKLGARPMAEASALGHRAATARGLSGPLAASVQGEAVGRAQDRYNQWRLGALNAYRQQFMDRLSSYMQALEARRQAQVRAGYAEREARIAQNPLLGPIGAAVARFALDRGWTPFEDIHTENIEKRGAYTAPTFGGF